MVLQVARPLDVCESPDDVDVRCDAGQFVITWFDPH
jgi:hypothetical protein